MRCVLRDCGVCRRVCMWATVRLVLCLVALHCLCAVVGSLRRLRRVRLSAALWSSYLNHCTRSLHRYTGRVAWSVCLSVCLSVRTTVQDLCTGTPAQQRGLSVCLSLCLSVCQNHCTRSLHRYTSRVAWFLCLSVCQETDRETVATSGMWFSCVSSVFTGW